MTYINLINTTNIRTRFMHGINRTPVNYVAPTPEPVRQQGKSVILQQGQTISLTTMQLVSK